MSCAGSVVLTQTHPAASYVCRTGNITLRCQYDGVENVLAVLWSIGGQTTANTSTIPGHTAFPPTSTYQEVVVDSYTNLAAVYHCTPVAMDHCYRVIHTTHSMSVSATKLNQLCYAHNWIDAIYCCRRVYAVVIEGI